MVVTKKVDTTAPDSRTEPKKASRDRVRKAKKNLKTEENQDESSNIVPEDEVGDPEPFSAELEVNSESQSNNEEELKPKNKKIVFEDIEMDDEIPSHIEDVVEDRKVPVEQPSPALEEEKEDSDDAPEEVQLSVTKEEGQKRRELERQLKQGYMSALDGLDWYRRKKKRRAHDSSSKKESQLLSEEVLNILNDNEHLLGGEEEDQEEELASQPAVQRILMDKGQDVKKNKYNFDLVKLSNVTERVQTKGVPEEITAFLNDHFYGDRVQRMEAGKYLKEKDIFIKKNKLLRQQKK